MKKYKLTGNTVEYKKRTLHQIIALKSFADVVTGDLGGWIESEDNLSQEGDCWVYKNAKVFDNAKVCENAVVLGSASVYENAIVYHDAEVFDDAVINGDANVFGNAAVYDNAWVTHNAKVYGNAQVYGNAEVFGNAVINGNGMVYGHAKVYGNAEVCENAKVCRYSRVHGDAKLFLKSKANEFDDISGGVFCDGGTTCNTNVENPTSAASVTTHSVIDRRKLI